MNEEIRIKSIKDIINKSEGRSPNDSMDVIIPEELYENDRSIPGTDITIHSKITPLSTELSSQDIKKSVSAIRTLFEDYKKRYNLKDSDININLNNSIDSFVDIIDPKKFRILEIATYDVLDKIRLSSVLKIAVAIQAMIEKVTSPDFLDSLDPRDMVSLTDRLFNQLERLTKMKSLIKVKDVDIEMRSLTSENQSENRDYALDNKILEILNKLRSEENQ